MSNIDDLLDKAAQERTASKWDPDPGDIIEGLLIKTGWYDGGEYDPALWLLIKDTEDGTYRRVYCPTVLRRQVTEEAPAMGSGIAIRYEGKVPSESNPKRTYHSYTLALVPAANGDVLRDPRYWATAGTYQLARASGATDDSVDEDDGSFF